jgi:plasmid stability protein
MKDYPSQEMDRFNVRLPAGMREAIAEGAKAHGRSMNSEIVKILQDTLNRSSLEIDKLNELDVTELQEIVKTQAAILLKYNETISNSYDTIAGIMDFLNQKKQEKNQAKDK